jgi:hypothetical protein
MIEDFEIDVSLGRDDQVGLFIRADPDMAQSFRRLLWREGLNSVRYMPPRRSGFTYFTYVSVPDSGLDKRGIHQQLLPLCHAHCTTSPDTPPAAPDYAVWHVAFETYVESYRSRHIPRTSERPADVFDKVRAHELIRSSQYEQAEDYLHRFATDDPPALLPAYLIYLYHEWNRPADVVETHNRYAAHLQASDVEHRVIEWVVKAYLSLTPPKSERALAVLDDFLPEFQRQGVAERLLVFRSQARALQGQLPQTVTNLHAYLAPMPTPALTDQLEDLLGVITGLPAPTQEVAALLDELAARIKPAEQWRIELRRSMLARRDGDLNEALIHLQAVLDTPSSTLGPADLDALRLDAADLYLALERPQDAVTILDQIAPDDLTESEQRAYWRLSGLALASTEPAAALEPLRRAYELGMRNPDALQSLARLAYRTGDSNLARLVYTDLLRTGFEPGPQDCLYAGTLAWLEDDPLQAVELLRDGIAALPRESSTSDEVLLAHEALVESLRAVDAPADEIANAISEWTDVLVALNDLDGLARLVESISEAGLDCATTFVLLEAIEPSLADRPDSKEQLAQTYVQLLCAEVDASLRQGQALPAYTLDLRRGLFELDRQQFDFAQAYLQEELTRAREAELIEAHFAPEPSEESVLDLSGRWVALVGGYEPVRRRVRETLTRDYGLSRFTEVPPSWEARVDQARVAEAVRGADLIVVVHRCIKHDGTDALKAVVDGTESEERIRYAAGKGQSSVIGVVWDHFGQNT